MPKGHKRKNTGVGVDFKRVKSKVGKKLPRAQNATDTTIKSKAISMPDQRVVADRDGQAVSRRHLNLKARDLYYFFFFSFCRCLLRCWIDATRGLEQRKSLG
jgi:hypothetical protein